jgi:hypothetical protein
VVRVNPGHATIAGWLMSTGNSTLDVRDADITGHVRVGGPSANFRLRDEGTIPGNVSITGDIDVAEGVLSIHTEGSAEAPTIDGDVRCQGRQGRDANVPLGIVFAEVTQGYLDCPGIPTNLSVSVDEDQDPVAIGSPVTYHLEVDNATSGPFVEGVDVVVEVGLQGIQATVGTVTPSQGECFVDLPGSVDSNRVVCRFGLVGASGVIASIEVVGDVGGDLLVNANVRSANVDTDQGDNSVFLTTTFQ